MVGRLVEDVDGAALVNKDFFNGVVFDFNSDDHGVILLMVEAMKVVIYEDDGRHTTFVVGIGDMIDGLDMVEVFLSGRRDGPPLAKPPEMVLMVPRKGVGRGDVGAGSWLAGWGGRLS